MLAAVHVSVVTAKSAVLAPVSITDTDDTASAPANGPLLLFVMTMGCGVPAVPGSWLPKFTLVGTEMDACVAVPESETVEGLPPPTFNVAERGPTGAAAVGLNVMLIWQLLPAAMLVHGVGVGT